MRYRYRNIADNQLYIKIGQQTLATSDRACILVN